MMLLLWRRCWAEVISVGCHLTVATVVTDVPSQPSIVVFNCDNNRDEVDGGDNCDDNRVEMLTNTYDSYYYVVTSL